MTEQLMLLEFAPATTTNAPRCRMCARPARWMAKAGEWGMYCTGGSCNNRNRLCQSCGRPFHMGIDGAGTKYCSIRCRTDGYRPGSVSGHEACAWCKQPSATKVRVRRSGWPYICSGCLYPIKHVVDRLKDHKVSHERARQLRDDPRCEICRADLLVPTRISSGKVQPLLVVDHDHRCCPGGSHSCGKCVRGLICRACNAAAGQLYDSPAAARALADYLDGWQVKLGVREER